ncbi:MAG TPA: hypothetical protein VIC85_20210 [Ktedonobacterales bacterium]
MDWGGLLRAAWRGDVPDGDLRASLAATASLAPLQQALDDRALAARIDNSGHDWRAVLTVGPIAAPLWLANALVALAGAFYDAATPSPSARAQPGIDPEIHDVVTALLAPVEDLAAATSAALADPDRRPALLSPVHIGPGGDVATRPTPAPLTAPYVRGLATGTRQLHTTSAAALAATRATVAASPIPDWLDVGLRQADAALRAAETRLDMAEVRLAAPGGAGDTLATCRDLWTIADVSMVAGQVIADPHLMAGAPSRTPDRVTPPRPTVPAPAPSAPDSPAPRPRRQPALALPQIAEGAPSPQHRLGPNARPPSSPTASHEDVLWPAIGPTSDSARPDNPSQPPATTPPNAALPTVGPTPTAPAAPRASTPPLRPPSAPPARAESRTDSLDDDQDPPMRFPEIG